MEKGKMKEFIANFFDITFWKFILVGIVNTLFGTGIMFLLYNLAFRNYHDSSWAYWVSSAANYILGSILSYILNRTFTFRNKAQTGGTAWRFVINISICYLVAYGVAKPLARLILSGASVTVQDNIAMLAGMCFFVGLNYIGQRFFVFREDRKQKEA